MGTVQDSLLSSVLFGKTRRAVLGLLYGQPEKSFYLREIARLTDSGQGSVQRELSQLTDAGILTRKKRGKETHFRANRQCPIFEEIRGMMLKTSGLADVLRDRLASLANDIELALIYGSQATGEAGSESDVDLMIVGEPDDLALHKALSTAEQQLSRSVNYTQLSPAEYKRRRKEKGGFVQRVLKGPRIILIGNPDDV